MSNIRSQREDRPVHGQEMVDKLAAYAKANPNMSLAVTCQVLGITRGQYNVLRKKFGLPMRPRNYTQNITPVP